MLIKIRSWITWETLHTIEADNLKTAVESLARQGAYLSRAYLSEADLSGASLNGADLSLANLSETDLSGASLSGANLSGASLNGADLSGASLNGADLYRADLSLANLSGANLSGANLSRANLSRANLSGASLGDLICLTELSDAIDLAPMIFEEWHKNGIEAARTRFGLYKLDNENKALIAMCPRFIGGYCFVLNRREIWWWQWSCPNPETVPVLWREAASNK